ncbi:hypothetical protein VTI74DRAFT_1488 [Chaetomium olivicolor]
MLTPPSAEKQKGLKLMTMSAYASNQADSGPSESDASSRPTANGIAKRPGALNILSAVWLNSAAKAVSSTSLTFGDTAINTRYFDFVWHYPDTDAYLLGAFEDSFPVLGDTFLRSTYVVYDWDNRNIHLCPSANCGSNLAPIGSSANAIPSLTSDYAPGTSTSSSSSSAPTSTSTLSVSSSSTDSSSSTTIVSKNI